MERRLVQEAVEPALRRGSRGSVQVDESIRGERFGGLGHLGGQDVGLGLLDERDVGAGVGRDPLAPKPGRVGCEQRAVRGRVAPARPAIGPARERGGVHLDRGGARARRAEAARIDRDVVDGDRHLVVGHLRRGRRRKIDADVDRFARLCGVSPTGSGGALGGARTRATGGGARVVIVFSHRFPSSSVRNAHESIAGARRRADHPPPPAGSWGWRRARRRPRWAR